MPEPRLPVEKQLHIYGSFAETGTAAVTASDVMTRRPGRSRRWLTAAAVVAVVGAAATTVLWPGDTGDRSSVRAVGATSATSAGEPETTTPALPAELADLAARLSRRGIAVVEGDDRIVLLTERGRVLHEGPAPELPPGGFRSPGAVLEVTPAGVTLGQYSPTGPHVDVPPGCRLADRRYRAVALCGPHPEKPNHIDVQQADGTWRTILRHPPTSPGVTPLGSWVEAATSPDGEWVVATWSAECEVPMAFLVRVDGTDLHTVTGQYGLDWRVASPESASSGWTRDGRAIVVLPAGACGGGTDPAGVYLVDPKGGAPELLYEVDAPYFSAIQWVSLGGS